MFQNKIVVHMYIYLIYDLTDLTDITDEFIYLFIEKTKTYIYRHCFCVFVTHGNEFMQLLAIYMHIDLVLRDV